MTKMAWWVPVRGVVVAVCLSGAVGATAPALASHYRLGVSTLVTPAEVDQLAKVGVTTTLALLQEVGDEARRKAFAKRSGLALERVVTLAHQVDLIRLDGVGPSMVTLLQAAGIQNSAALAAANVDALHAQLVATNAARKLVQVVPPSKLLGEWIAQAKRLPRVVSGL